MKSKAMALADARENRVRREYGDVRKETWQADQDWAAALSDADLRTARRLRITGDPGIAVDSEYRRRFGVGGTSA